MEDGFNMNEKKGSLGSQRNREKQTIIIKK
jgi:hypothetical protein